MIFSNISATEAAIELNKNQNVANKLIKATIMVLLFKSAKKHNYLLRTTLAIIHKGTVLVVKESAQTIKV